MRSVPKAIGISVLVLFAALMSGSALAEHHDRGHGHGSGGGVRFGISIGVPLYAPSYYPAPISAYPTYIYPAPAYVYPAQAYVYPAPAMAFSSAPVFVERRVAPVPTAPMQAQGDWYYCAASGSYYPYVADCPAGWQRVPAQASAR